MATKWLLVTLEEVVDPLASREGHTDSLQRGGFVAVKMGGQATMVPFRLGSDGKFARETVGSMTNICVYYGPATPSFGACIVASEFDHDRAFQWTHDFVERVVWLATRIKLTVPALSSALFDRATEADDQSYKLDVVDVATDLSRSGDLWCYLSTEGPTVETSNENAALRSISFLPQSKALKFRVEVVDPPSTRTCARVGVVLRKCHIPQAIQRELRCSMQRPKVSVASSACLVSHLETSSEDSTSPTKKRARRDREYGSTLPTPASYSRNLGDFPRCRFELDLLDAQPSFYEKPAAIAVALKLTVRETLNRDETLRASDVIQGAMDSAFESSTNKTGSFVRGYVTKAPESARMLVDSRSLGTMLINMSQILPCEPRNDEDGADNLFYWPRRPEENEEDFPYVALEVKVTSS